MDKKYYKKKSRDDFFSICIYTPRSTLIFDPKKYALRHYIRIQILYCVHFNNADV